MERRRDRVGIKRGRTSERPDRGSGSTTPGASSSCRLSCSFGRVNRVASRCRGAVSASSARSPRDTAVHECARGPEQRAVRRSVRPVDGRRRRAGVAETVYDVVNPGAAAVRSGAESDPSRGETVPAREESHSNARGHERKPPGRPTLRRGRGVVRAVNARASRPTPSSSASRRGRRSSPRGAPGGASV